MFQIDVFPAAEAAALHFIEITLTDFNRKSNPEFWAARELIANAAQPLSVVARTHKGRVIGGLIGETQFKWLKISLMTVEASVRRQSVGSSMIIAAETEAIRRACQYSYVDTMDYQAPAFYTKMGYSISGCLEDWDSHGHSKLFFVKRLEVPSTAS